ncbi:MlaD family protein [Mycobacterium kyogaense]|uniref:MlaD family protein n=1 Tax=Mycobacterium kyogaense TaxID=2212479 RepID=UPI000DAF2B79|nr:MlaD family protein [Mycobacterium kyogaense]
MNRHRLRGRRRVICAFLAITAMLLCGSCAPVSTKKASTYCAILPDSVGLYVDNPVTQMGYRIGEISSVTSSEQSVRVEFTVDEPRDFPADVRVVLRSASILANRSLELVGNYDNGPKLQSGNCIPLGRSFTPKSLSQVIGSSTDFLNAISPERSNNVAGVLQGVDQAVRGQGRAANRLLMTTSSVLDSPDQPIADLGSIVNNLGQLTNTLVDLEPTLKSVFADAKVVGPDVVATLKASSTTFDGLIPVTTMAGDLEAELGPQIQQLLDAVSVAVRKMTPRAPFYASILNAGPRYITGITNIMNNHQFNTLRYRPPLYRIRTPDGVLQCNIMNASVPGSCANVQGTPYAVDVALLQYVLTEANR